MFKAQKTKTQFVFNTCLTAFTHKSPKSSHEEGFPLPFIFSLQGLIRPRQRHGVRVCLCRILCSTGIFVVSVILPVPSSIYWTPGIGCSVNCQPVKEASVSSPLCFFSLSLPSSLLSFHLSQLVSLSQSLFLFLSFPFLPSTLLH